MSSIISRVSDWRAPFVVLTQDVRQAIRQARLCYGYTYAELAKCLNTSSQTPYYWEKGSYKSISYFTWLKICNALKLDSDMIPRPQGLSDKDVRNMKNILPLNRRERLVSLVQTISRIEDSVQIGIISEAEALSLKEQIVDENLGKILLYD